MKAEDLKTKTIDELSKLLLDHKKAQFNMRFQRANATLDKTSEIRENRRTIARIKTFLNAKKAEETAPKKAPAKKEKSSKKAA